MEYYYKAYNIVFNRNYIEREQYQLDQYLLKNDDRYKTKKELNKTIVEKYKENGKKRHETILEETKNYWGTPNYTQKELLRIDDNYIENNNMLVNTLISKHRK